MLEFYQAYARYQDLMDDALVCVEGIYSHFSMELSIETRRRMSEYLSAKPKGKFGSHKYSIDESELEERKYFARYQQAYNVPNEV